MNKQNEHSDERLSLFARVLAGEESLQERNTFESLLEKDPTAKDEFEKIRKLWDNASGLTQDQMNEDWNKLYPHFKSENKNSYKSYLRIAASILVIITLGIAGSLLFFNNEEAMIADVEILEKSLTDGSEISLNKGSTLTINKNFNEKNRKVELEGEAFFKVEKNKELPFIVSTRHMNIQVVGTEFNVKTSKKTTTLIVKEGIVRVQAGTERKEVTAGQMALYDNETDQLYVTINSDVNYLSWRTKSFSFRDTSLSTVVDKLNEIYNASIALENESIAECKVTVDFKNEDLETIIIILQETLQLDIKKQNERVILSGKGC